MGTLNQKRSFRVRFPCSKKLLNEFQTNYQENYKNKIKRKFAVRTTEQTYTEFAMYAAFFKTKSVALDYLISNEVDPGMDLTYSDNASSS